MLQCVDPLNSLLDILSITFRSLTYFFRWVLLAAAAEAYVSFCGAKDKQCPTVLYSPPLLVLHSGSPSDFFLPVQNHLRWTGQADEWTIMGVGRNTVTLCQLLFSIVFLGNCTVNAVLIKCQSRIRFLQYNMLIKLYVCMSVLSKWKRLGFTFFHEFTCLFTDTENQLKLMEWVLRASFVDDCKDYTFFLKNENVLSFNTAM